ncbi:YbbR-like domain-containing protein [Seonamhaeicola algicola]|uniref:YbbR-like domain-containing protein n=1 Tax=Seonamhaeicola algicola TaxID=1719036 RepID=A0A5C7ATR7_9FLAO|nr:YbbR-like domain-containing protein [Seonamhaeicola algicola]
MGKIKSKIAASIKSKKLNVFFLFLLFSFVILIVSKLSKDYTNTVSFQIEKINVPQEHVILNDSVQLNITLKTHGFKWLNYYFKKPKVQVDFSKDVIKKNKTYIYNKSKAYLNNTQFDKQVELLSINPDTLFFRFDTNMVKKVPVTLNASINYAIGYNALNAIALQPDSVVVIGPHVLVSKIKNLPTEQLVLNDVRDNIDTKIALKLPKAHKDLTLSAKQISVTADVEKFTEGTLKIPINVINVPKGVTIKIFPKEVTVAYYVSLKNFQNVVATDFEVVCNYAKITENQSVLVPELVRVPNTVKSAKINNKQIEFIITK